MDSKTSIDDIWLSESHGPLLLFYLGCLISELLFYYIYNKRELYIQEQNKA